MQKWVSIMCNGLILGKMANFGVKMVFTMQNCSLSGKMSHYWAKKAPYNARWLIFW